MTRGNMEGIDLDLNHTLNYPVNKCFSSQTYTPKG